MAKVESQQQKPELLNYHIFPPFIDAYLESYFTEKPLTLSDIHELMKFHAWEWGAEVVGRSILRGMSIPMFSEAIVLCCAYTSSVECKENGKQYLAVIQTPCDDWFNNLQFIEGNIQDEWDAT